MQICDPSLQNELQATPPGMLKIACKGASV